MINDKNLPEFLISGSLAPSRIGEHDNLEKAPRFQEAIKKAMQQVRLDVSKGRLVTMTRERAEGIVQLAAKLEAMGLPPAIDANNARRDQ